MTSTSFGEGQILTDPLADKANGVPFEKSTIFQHGESAQEYAVNSGVSDHARHVRRVLFENDEEDIWEVVVSDETMLQLDYDTPYIPHQFLRMLEILEESMGHVSQPWKAYKSRSGNTHIIVKLSQYLPYDQRVAWQAAFGSDPKREALHLLSNKRGDTNTMLLVMRKDRPEVI